MMLPPFNERSPLTIAMACFTYFAPPLNAIGKPWMSSMARTMGERFRRVQALGKRGPSTSPNVRRVLHFGGVLYLQDYRRVWWYERALLTIAARKPHGEPMTEADHERAVQVAAMVERYEAHLRAAVKPRVAESEPAAVAAQARPVRRRRRRRTVAQPAPVAKRRGRPPKAGPPPENIPGQ